MKRYTDHFYVIALALLATSAFFACKADTVSSGGNNTSGANVEQELASAPTADVVNEKGNLEDIIAESRELAKAHETWKQKVRDLREAFRAVPYEVRQNAVGSDELEARLDGFIERGDFMIDEMNQTARKLEEALKGNKNDDELVRCISAINEHRKTLPEVEDNLVIMKKAVEALKASVPSKGKGVVLFR